MINTFILFLLAIITSFITATVGMGGGMLLLAFLPSFLPAKAIIPIHGTVQLSSNASRFVFQIHNNLWRPFLLFSIGGVFGALLGGSFLKQINLDYLPVIMSVLILIVLWSNINKFLSKVPGKYFSLGILQTGLSLYVGAVGPLSASVLQKDGYDIDQVIVTNASINTTLNIFKLLTYLSLGFVFYDYLLLITAMSAGAMFGSYLGTKFRANINKEKAKKLLKVIITLVCIKNLLVYFFS